MQRKKTSKKVAKKPVKRSPRAVSKKASKKPPAKVSKKATKKSSAKVSKKATRKSSKNASSTPGHEESASDSANSAKQRPSKKDKRPILVPVDFSAHSEAALEFAADLAERLGSSIAVLHVVHDPGEAPGYYRVKGRKKQLRRLEDVAEDMLNEFMKKMIKRQPKRTVLRQAKRLLVIGLPATRILEVAEKLKPRMVVMGSAGRTGLSHFLLGSKAEQLVRICPFPVTIVKAPEK